MHHDTSSRRFDLILDISLVGFESSCPSSASSRAVRDWLGECPGVFERVQHLSKMLHHFMSECQSIPGASIDPSLPHSEFVNKPTRSFSLQEKVQELSKLTNSTHICTFHLPFAIDFLSHEGVSTLIYFPSPFTLASLALYILRDAVVDVSSHYIGNLLAGIGTWNSDTWQRHRYTSARNIRLHCCWVRDQRSRSDQPTF